MSLFSQKAVALMLAAVASFGTASVYAASKTAASVTPAQKVSVLAGKFSFTLPKGFIANPLSAGDEAKGTAGATGTMYTNQATRTVVIVAENTIPDGLTVKDNDAAFLDDAVSGFASEQRQALPDFNKQSEKSLTVKGLGLRQIDSTATQGGGQTLNTSLLAGSGTRMTLIQIISRADDKAGHGVLVQQILGSK